MLSFPIIYYWNSVVVTCWTAGQKNSYTRIFSKKDSSGHLQERKLVSVLGSVYMEKTSPGWKCHSLTKWTTLGEPTFHTFPSRTWRPVYTTNRELARLEDVRDTLPTGSTFFSIYKTHWLAQPGQDNQSMCERSWLGQRRQLFCHKLKVESAGKVPLWRGKAFLLGNGALAEWQNYLEIRLRERSNLKTFVLGSS